MTTRFCYLSIAIFCLFFAFVGLMGCRSITPVANPDPTSTLLPETQPIDIAIVANPTIAVQVTHPELEVITPQNVDRLKQIDQWGQGNVHGVALSPNGNLIAVATTTGIYLYDRITVEQVGYIDIPIGSEIEPQLCPPSGVLAFSPDGSILAISSTDITLWDLDTETIQTVIENQIEDMDSNITEIQFSSDGSRIMSVHKKASVYPCYSGWGSLVIYDVDTGELIFRHNHGRYEEGPRTMFVDKDGIAYISYHDASRSGYYFLEVDLQTGAMVEEKLPQAIHSMSNAGAVIYERVTTDDNGESKSQTHIVDLVSFADIVILDEPVKLIPGTDRMLLYDQQELTVQTLDGQFICSHPVNSEVARAFPPEMFSVDGTIAVSWNYYGRQAGDIHIWDLDRCNISGPVLIFPEPARQMSISSDGRSVLTGSQAGYTFYVFDTQTGQLRFSLSGFDAQLSADGQQVFVVEEEAVKAYDIETGEYLHHVLDAESDYMTEIVVSPDGRFIAIDNESNGTYRILSFDDNLLTGGSIAYIDGYPYFSKDGKLMAEFTGLPAANQLRFWDLSTRNELPDWQGLLPNEGYYANISFNSDFTQVATKGTDGYYKYVYIWDIPELSLMSGLRQPFPNGDRQLSNLKFISDDRILFVRGSNPDAFLFWDVETGNLLVEIPTEVHESELGTPVVFSPDGRLLMILDNDGTVHVWGIR